jgi:hypothetical protein
LFRFEERHCATARLDISDFRSGTLTVETAVFVDGVRRIAMDFVEGVLVPYTVRPE